MYLAEEWHLSGKFPFWIDVWVLFYLVLLEACTVRMTSIIHFNLWFCCFCPSSQLSAEACTCRKHSTSLLYFTLQSKRGGGNSCGSFLDRSLHTSVTTYCSCSLRALLRICHCVSAAWNARNFQPSTLANIRKHYAKYAKFLASTWNTPKTVMCRGCHHINGNRIRKIFI